MRTIINYIRSCFCRHDWELIFESDIVNDITDKTPINRVKVYRCKKCGVSRKYSVQ